MKATDYPHISTMLVLAIALSGVSAFIQVYPLQAVLPVLMHDFAASEIQAGMAVGATVAGMALVSPFIGMISDAIGRKSLMIFSLLVLMLPTAAMGFVDDIHYLIAWRFVQGVCVPGITVTLIAYIGEEFAPHQVTKLMTVYVSGTVLGGFLGRFLMGYMDAFSGWRLATWLFAAFSGFCAFCVWRYLPVSRRFVPNANFQAALNTLGQHLHNRHLLAACALGVCVLWSLVGCFTYVNLHLADEPFHLDSQSLANLFAIYLIGMVITPLSARLIGRLGGLKTVLLAVGVSMLGVAGALVMNLWGVLLALTLMSTGVFITQSATISYIATHVKQGRSLATGLYYMAYYAGGTIGAYACGWAYTHGGWSATVAVLLAVQVLALAIAYKGMDD
ncbi:MFS transporter [Neisseriaceae bacterium B1]